MPEDYAPYIQRHLARNVPLNFSECCEIVRSAQEVEKRIRKSTDGIGYKKANFNRIYNGMIEKLIGDGSSPELENQIGSEIFEVEIRFEVVQRTIDYNIPAGSIFKSIRQLKTNVSRTIGSLNMDTNQRSRGALRHRDQNVRFFLGLDDNEDIPNTIDEFRSAQSIAEKAAIANSLLIGFQEQLDELYNYFNYKGGLVTAGQPSVFAVLYVVHALADIFERYNSKGLKASVGMDPTRGGEAGPNEYTGDFLEFVMAFIMAVDYAEIRRNEETKYSHTGLHARIRRLAKKRKADPDLYKLLHEKDVDHHSVLEFMKRAEAIK